MYGTIAALDVFGPTMSDSEARVPYCRAPDPTHYLAVIGVIGIASQVPVRDAIRRTWLHDDSGRILSQFVLRGIGVSPSTVAEAATHQDMVFLPANVSIARMTGPLWSNWLWLQCARTAWPHSRLIGKAETDVWLHLPGIGLRLLADMHAWARQRSDKPHPRIYWGVFESFHWDLSVQRPHGFGYKFGVTSGVRLTNCSVRRASASGHSEGKVGFEEVPLPPDAASNAHTYLGPFNFAKGPLIIFSRSLLGEMLDEDSWASRSLQRISAQVAEKFAPVVNAPTYPQDDTWLGMALATSVRPSAAPLVALHAGSVIYAEGLRDRAYPLYTTTLIWHNGHALNKADAGLPNNTGSLALAQRIEALHELMQRTPGRCDSPNTTLNCLSSSSPSAPISQRFHTCAGAALDRCLVVHAYSACPKERLYEWGTG